MGQQDNVLENNLIEEQCGTTLQFYKKGKDKPSSGFQKGDEIREEVHV